MYFLTVSLIVCIMLQFVLKKDRLSHNLLGFPKYVNLCFQKNKQMQ
jgi:hypothetical protein